ncbi:MAG: tetratricopeptide repeat protein [Candidatus Promineofilum sp.]|uniref:hypothetical protein n=1 Tax=Promineifilum sp. TaxID=2664178 RepID=UPI0024120718|nr:tetratricopeptide repeat protein [Promineifilum sp.]
METAEEVPLASSYNTLALIYDDMGRYEDAPLLSAKAIAYCRRATENRQLALALRQMAESLRHVAGRAYTGQRAGSPDNFFDAAERLLNDARAIFSDLSEVELVTRSIWSSAAFSAIEWLLRRIDKDEGLDKHSLRFYYQEALNSTDRAESAAPESMASSNTYSTHNLIRHASISCSAMCQRVRKFNTILLTKSTPTIRLINSILAQ